MRVTNNMMMESFKGSLFKNTQLLMKFNERISTGKQINRPSDDPAGMGKVLNYRKTISIVDQYVSNIDRAETQNKITETVLDAVADYIGMTKDIAMDQSMGSVDRQSAAQQVKSIYDQLMQLANTKSGNVYLFSGNQTDTVPFTRNADTVEGTIDDYDITYHGDDGVFKIIIGEKNHMKINIHGQEVFTGESLDDGVNIFNVLKDLINGLENPDTEAGTTQITNQIDLLDKAAAQVNRARTINTGIYERLISTRNYWTDFRVSLEQLLSNIEDADITKAVVDLKNQEVIYEITIASAGEIIQLNLINFLR